MTGSLLKRNVVGFFVLILGTISGSPVAATEQAPLKVPGTAEATEAKTPEAKPPLPTEVIISVPDQKMRVMRGGIEVASYPISTSRFGLGDAFRSYRTPLGLFRISGKVGGNLPKGAVLKGRRFTGEVLPVNAPGRDPIVTRIIQLQGLEDHNKRAEQRGIYIHGTPEERNIGRPVSFGCIRMRSSDVVKLFEKVDVGTRVMITTRRARTVARAAIDPDLARQLAAARHSARPVARRSTVKSPGSEIAKEDKKRNPLSLSWEF